MSHVSTWKPVVTVALVVLVAATALAVQFDPPDPEQSVPRTADTGASAGGTPDPAGVSAGTAPPSVDPSPPAAAPVDRPIDSCRVIDTPGRYTLVADVESDSYTCLTVAADDVVLDGGGHTVTVAADAHAYGRALGISFGEAVVLSGARSNVTVTNLSVVGFGVGITGDGGSDITLDTVTASNAVTGVDLDGVDGVRIESTTATLIGRDGIVVRNATDAELVDVTAREAWFAGVVVERSDRVSVVGAVVDGNHGDGLFVHDSTAVAVDGVTAVGNGVGVLVVGTDGASLGGVTADRNAIAGVAVVDADGVTVADSVVTGTFGESGLVDHAGGVLVVGARDATLRDVRALDNDDWTVVATDSATASVENLTVGSTSVSFAIGDAAVRLGWLADGVCTPAAADTVVAGVRENSTATAADGALTGISVECVG